MLPTGLSAASELPEFSYGSVWLMGAGDGDLCHLSQFAVHTLSTADAVIHDPGIPQQMLDCVTPPVYCEAAEAEQAVERAVKLTQDGWQVLYLVKGSAAERAGECAVRLAGHGILLRILSNIGGPIGGETPIKLLLVWQPVPVEGSQAGRPIPRMEPIRRRPRKHPLLSSQTDQPRQRSEA